VTVSVAHTGGSPDVSVTSGTSLTFTPANWDQLQTVMLAAAEDLGVVTDFATLTVSATGLTSESVEVRVVDNSGSFGGPAPGRIPNGGSVPGLPLRLAKTVLTPGQLDLAWDPSCSPEGVDYAVYEGTLGAWYSHNPLRCTTDGSGAVRITPGAGNRYYLVVPMSAFREGSFGTDSAGIERPGSASRCRTEKDPSACP
jgi:hypothetical protein